jgi:hypothetical protein
MEDIASGAYKMYAALSKDEMAALANADRQIDHFSRTLSNLRKTIVAGAIQGIEATLLNPNFGPGAGLRGITGGGSQGPASSQPSEAEKARQIAQATKGFAEWKAKVDKETAQLAAEQSHEAERDAMQTRRQEEKDALDKINEDIREHYRQYKKTEEATYSEVQEALREQHKQEKEEADAAVEAINESLRQRKDEYKDAEEETNRELERILEYRHAAFGKMLDGMGQLFGAMESLGGKIGSVGGMLGGITGGVGGVSGGLKDLSDAKGMTGITGLMGKVGAYGQIAASAIQIGSALWGGIKSLFGGDQSKKDAAEAGKILGRAVSKEQAKQLAADAKAAGKTFTEYVRGLAAEEKKQKAVEARQNLEAGLGTARGGAESLLGRMGAEGAGFSETLKGIFGSIIGKVSDALMAAGMGILDARLQGSQGFQGAQGAAGDIATVLSGMRQAGVLDQGLLGMAGGAASELQAQAIAAAKEAGLSDAEAQKAGSAAIAGLLREQLNASVASGKELDANTKALLDQARANGIDILADPAIESVAVQKESLAVLRDIAGKGGGMGGDSGATHAAKGIGPFISRGEGLIHYHPDELIWVLPSNMRRGAVLHAARGLSDDPGSGSGSSGGGYAPPSDAAAAAAAAENGGSAGPTSTQQIMTSLAQLVAAASPIVVQGQTQVVVEDKSLVHTEEGQRAFGKHVVSEVESALAQKHAGLMREIGKINDQRLRDLGLL